MTHITLRWKMRVVKTRGGPIKWFDGQGDHPVTAKAMGLKSPAGWDKTVEAVLAHHSSVHVALASAAAELHAKASARLAAHRDTGASRVGIERGDYLDWYVYLEDVESRKSEGPTKNASGKRSALSIEFGHLTRSGSRVGGLFILTGAVSGMANTPRRRWDK
jgi:hypothetical protein